MSWLLVTKPDWLLSHQADAVLRAWAILGRFGGVLIADGSSGGAGVSAPSQPTTSAGGPPPAPRDEWRTDPPQLPPTSIPAYGGAAGAV